jgi:hypothetical protein
MLNGERGNVKFLQNLLTITQDLHGGLYNMSRSVKIWFSDFQVDNVSSLNFQGFGPSQNFKGCFCIQLAHSLSK